MSQLEARFPRGLSPLETWGFGFTVLLFWIVVAPVIHETLGPGALAVWLPAALVGITVNLQIRRLALARPSAAGGSPVYVAGLWSDRPLVARWAGLAYFHSWAIVPPAVAWLLADLAVRNLDVLGHAVSPWPLQLLLLGAIYLTAFSGIRVLSVVHLFFLLPSLGLLLLFGVQGLGWVLLEGSAAPGAATPWQPPSWDAWIAGYFVVAYTTYGIDTAAAFTADSRRPRATIECLVAAAVLVVPVMVGGSWLLARAGPPAGTGLEPIALLESVSAPYWGAATPLAVTFMLASAMVLAGATSVAVSPRVAWQLSQDGVLASTFGRMHRQGVPRAALSFAAGLGLLYLWLGPAQMILLGGATWLGFWFLMHLGLWRRRDDPSVLWPRLALGLAILEGTALVVGGWLAGGLWVVAGLLIPVVLMGFDLGVRRHLDPALPAPRLAPSPVRRTDAWEIVLVVLLLVITVVVGWLVGRAVGSDPSPAGVRISVIVLLLSAFVGIAWASWTSLRKLELLDGARAQLQDVLDAAMDAVMVVDPKGFVVSVNRAAEELFGRSAEELQGQPLPGMVPSLQGTPSRWGRWEEHSVPNPGGPRTVELAARASGTAPGEAFTVTLRDLTHRKSVENALRDSEQRLDLALEASHAGVWDMDVGSGLIVRGPRWNALVGYAPGAVPGTFEGWRSLLHPDDREPTLRRLREHMEGRVPTYSSEHRVRTASGEWLWVLDRGLVVSRHEDGTAERLIGTTTDLSERKKLEAAVIQAQKMEAVGQLAGGVAHDFNNVLTAILGTSELLLAEGERLDAGQREDLNRIRDGALRAAEITHQLLAFSRRQRLDPRSVDPNPAVARVEVLLTRLVGENVVVQTKCHRGLVRVRADPAQLEQAIVALALNGRDAMPGGGTLTIGTRPVTLTPEMAGRFRDVHPGPAVAISVSDTGEGMDQATRRRLFEPFFTTKGVGKGTGLGLAMVYGFVRQSGGAVQVESEPGRGTTVTLLFPEVGVAPPAPAPDGTGGEGPTA